MRLIDADAKIMAQLYDDEHEEWIQKEMTVADYLSFSDTAIPFVDAVPVVRCWECKHSKKWYADKSMCYLWHEDGIDVFNDGFCSYGKRKDGAE